MVVLAETLYPSLRKFFLETSLNRTHMMFVKDTGATEDEEPMGKKAKKLAKMELTTACAAWLQEQLEKKCELVASDIYGAVRRYLEANALNKALKAFDKETGSEDGEEVAPKGKKAKALARCDLLEAATSYLQALKMARATDEAEVVEEEKPNKRKLSDVAAETVAQEAEAEPEPVAKKSKADKQAAKEARANKTPGVPFKRVDDDAWRSKIVDSRLLDNTHMSKSKFGGSAGDSWGDSASVDMLKVKGKGFRKEMAKKKRASWRGSGSLDQGVNSIAFPESDDE